MTSMPGIDTLAWDDANNLTFTQTSSGASERVYYVYDASGQRIRKVVERYQSGTWTRVKDTRYLGGFELQHTFVGGTLTHERETLHLMDGTRRLALVETDTIDAGTPITTPTPLLRYQLDNHQRSSCVEANAAGDVISYEEFHPWGTTAYHAGTSQLDANPKRYRYSGKERDAESGLYYYGARYLAPWLGRWISPDPSGFVDGVNVYAFVRGRASTGWDEEGRWDEFSRSMFEQAGRAIHQAAMDIAEQVKEGIGEFAEGAVLGNYDDTPSVSGVVGQAVGGMLPVVGQAADARDFIHSAVEFAKRPSWSTAANLGIDGIAVLPLVGDGARAVVRLNDAPSSPVRVRSSDGQVRDANVPRIRHWSHAPQPAQVARPGAAGTLEGDSDAARTALGLSRNDRIQAHHILPSGIVGRFEVLQEAARNGWDQNNSSNLIALHSTDLDYGGPLHSGSHGVLYDPEVLDQLRNLNLRYLAGEFDDNVQSLFDEIQGVTENLRSRLLQGEFSDSSGRLSQIFEPSNRMAA